MLIEKFDEITKLDAAIDKLISEMLKTDVKSEEYGKMADQLTKLIKTKEIVGNLKLKSFEAINKKENDENNLHTKENELSLRQEEFEFRKTEFADNLEIRRREIRNRADELAINQTLKAQELELRGEELEDRRHVSKETLAVIGANLAGIVLILGYERVNVIASKALGFVSKLR
jgi:hypothetical protein